MTTETDLDPDLYRGVYGFKLVNPKTMFEAEGIFQHLVRMEASGPVPVPMEEYSTAIDSIRLNDRVPLEIRRIFEIAKSTAKYGFYYYPLYIVAKERSNMALEAALSMKCAANNAPPGVERFARTIEWLFSQGHITLEQNTIFSEIKETRNDFLHSAVQMQIPPGWSISWLEHIASSIDSLFKVQ